MWTHLILATALVALTAQTATIPAKPWIGRYAEYEDFLKTADIAKISDVPIGVTKPRRVFFKPGGLAESAIVKDLKPGRKMGYWESYKSEIAAYEVDKLLELEMVPTTVERRVEGEMMSAQLWVNDTVWLKELKGQNAPDVVKWNRQVYRQRVFDNLTANIDRNEGNLLVVRDPQWHLVLVDHSRAFTETTKMPFPMTRIDKPVFEKLKALTPEVVKEKVGPYLLDGGKSLLKRRDMIVAHFEKLAAETSPPAVFIP